MSEPQMMSAQLCSHDALMRMWFVGHRDLLLVAACRERYLEPLHYIECAVSSSVSVRNVTPCLLSITQAQASFMALLSGHKPILFGP